MSRWTTGEAEIERLSPVSGGGDTFDCQTETSRLVSSIGELTT